VKTIINIVLCFFLCVWAGYLHAQTPKGKQGTFALTNATIETVTKGRIANGTVILRNGKIEAVGAGVVIPQDAEIMDCTGLFIYPGMIDCGTTLGLAEIVSDPRSNDASEIGEVIPQMKALTAINPGAVGIPVTRVNGVTTVLSVPVGGLFPGTAALINLYGYTSDQMSAGFEGVVLNFPSTSRRNNNDRRTDDEIKKTYDESIKKLNDLWERLGQYDVIDSISKGKAPAYYPEMEALLPVARGQRALLIEVNVAKDILAALDWIKEKKIRKPILTGTLEGWRVASKIAEANIPVITGPVMALPSRDYDRYDKPYSNPGLLKKAGVKVAIKSAENNDSNFRNLPYHAGFAAAYGMGKDEALQSITIVPAEILGVADRLGSIEAGKDATLFICDGDPFEPATKVKQVFINGWQIPMVSRQTQLYDEFLKREPGLTK
jgi:imidazolonepropionase-like amidohydrolase